MKDNFSDRSEEYATFRPGYPQEVYSFLQTLLAGKVNAWDVGTGNGQVAIELSRFFEHVYATDISQSQLEQAVQKKNIYYSLQAAEKTRFKDGFFDLCMVAQAIHWFDFEAFYREVNRTVKEGAFLVVMGYGLIRINPEIDRILNYFYSDILGSYWDKERKFIDEGYKTIPFPFEEITVPDFDHFYQWSFQHLLGYLSTWSAVKHYRRETGIDPLQIVYPDLEDKWGGKRLKKVHFPLLLRVGRKVAEGV
jgi:SAM-dependent methyltransferase